MLLVHSWISLAQAYIPRLSLKYEKVLGHCWPLFTLCGDIVNALMTFVVKIF